MRGCGQKPRQGRFAARARPRRESACDDHPHSSDWPTPWPKKESEGNIRQLGQRDTGRKHSHTWLSRVDVSDRQRQKGAEMLHAKKKMRPTGCRRHGGFEGKKPVGRRRERTRELRWIEPMPKAACRSLLLPSALRGVAKRFLSSRKPKKKPLFATAERRGRQRGGRPRWTWARAQGIGRGGAGILPRKGWLFVTSSCAFGRFGATCPKWAK